MEANYKFVICLVCQVCAGKMGRNRKVVFLLLSFRADFSFYMKENLKDKFFEDSESPP